MQLEAMGKPIKYRLKTGEEVTLLPGIPTELPDPAATQLLKKAPDKVRLVDGESALQPRGVLIESAGPNARPVFWESVDGTWHGPSTPEYLGRIETGRTDQSWVIVSEQGCVTWVHESRLRSSRQYEAQQALNTSEGSGLRARHG